MICDTDVDQSFLIFLLDQEWSESYISCKFHVNS
jgi:hypothetical protein